MKTTCRTRRPKLIPSTSSSGGGTIPVIGRGGGKDRGVSWLLLLLLLFGGMDEGME